MDRRSQSIVLAGLLAFGATVCIVAVSLSTSSSESSPQAESKVAVEPASPASTQHLRDQVRSRDDVIARLGRRVSDLERQLADLSKESETEMAPEAVEPTPERDAARVPQVEQRSRGALGLGSATQWLQHLFPEKLGSLTEEEAEYLRELDLRGAEITDADLEHLLALPSLQDLSLRGTPVTDEGLVYLGQMTQLRHLQLRGTQITGSGLDSLPPNLETLDLTDTKVAEEALVRLPRLPALQSLDLNRAQIGDGFMEVLGAYSSLRKVELDSTGITDEGVRRLLELNPTLERLEVRDTKVSKETIEELRRMYPGLAIINESPFGATFGQRF